MEFTLTNDRQREYYWDMCERRVPKFLANGFVHAAHPTVDFMVALMVLWAENKTYHPWVEKHITPTLESRIGTATVGQQKVLVEAMSHLVRQRVLRNYLLASTFNMSTGNYRAAVNIFSNLAQTLRVGNFATGGHTPSIELLLALIGKQSISRAWSQFLKSVRQGDTLATQTFENLFEFWEVNREVPHFVPLSSLPEGYGRSKDTNTRIWFAVPDGEVNYLNTQFALLQQRCDPDPAGVASLLESFWIARKGFQERSEQMWQEVLTSASCDIQSDGSDGAEILLPALRKYGMRRIQFIPKARRPSSTIHFWYEGILSGQKYYRPYELDSPDLKLPTDNEVLEHPTLLFSSLCHFLAVTGLWLICTGRYKKMRHGSTGRKSVVGHPNPDHRPPRAHYREIGHLGWHPSREAIARAEQHWPDREPPEGYTFVKPEKVPQYNRATTVVVNPDELSVLCQLNESVLHV